MTCKTIYKIVVTTSAQKLFSSVLTPYSFNLKVLKERQEKQKTENYGSIPFHPPLQRADNLRKSVS